MNILVFGDSITQGFDDTEKGGWVNRLFISVSARQFGQNHDDYCAVFNLGISGDTTDALLKRIETELLPRIDTQTVIIFDIGGNDCVRNLITNECQVPLLRFVKNYQELITRSKEHGRVICLGLHDSDESRLNPIPHYKNHACLREDHEKYDAEIQRLSLENEVIYVKMSGILSQDFQALTYDGDHPSARGHEMIYEKIMEALQHNAIIKI